MIYTYGNTMVYRKYIAECKNNGTVPTKIGISKDEKYGGGIAFKTIEEAREGCLGAPEPYTVFELDGSWENDVYFDDENNINRLKNSLPIVGEAN